MLPSQAGPLLRGNSTKKICSTLFNNAPLMSYGRCQIGRKSWRMVLLYLLVWQLHVELLIVDPLGADDGLGVLVGFQLLRVAVELHKLVSRLQLGISRHFTWTKKFKKCQSCKYLGLLLNQTHCAKVSWVAVLIGKSPKVSERQRGSPECNCVWRFCKSHTLLFVQHTINIVCNTCPSHCESYLPGPEIATEHTGLAV